MTSDSVPYTIRAAHETDLEQIFHIYKYYVLNSTISLLLNEPVQSYISTRYHGSLERNLPYLVAVQSDSSDTSSTASTANSTTEKILGFAHAYPFNAGRSGYGTSVEPTLYLHPTCISHGIGTALMSTLLEQLTGRRCLGWEEKTVAETVKEEFVVRRVYVVMSSDLAPSTKWQADNKERGQATGWPQWEARGERTRDWYIRRFGFKEVGRLNGAGWKFGRETDLIYLEKTLP